jgi:hypothetical protein
VNGDDMHFDDSLISLCLLGLEWEN